MFPWIRGVAGVLVVSGALTGVTLLGIAPVQAEDPSVITLTQTGCQFVEPEGVDHDFKTTSGDDCRAINKQNGAERLSKSHTLELKSGTYVFRVTNKNVPYELGFYLRGAGFGRLTLPKVSGGGLETGVTKDYEITLKEGDYFYSCPLNPTPDYHIVVKN